jgi:pre-mRNA-splicing factor ATP-dependent RNA helicase DHX16
MELDNWKRGRIGKADELMYVFYLRIRLTEREKQDRKFKKELLTLAREHDQARNITKIQRYTMPEERRGKEGFEYEEVDDRERHPNSEQKKWEDEQMSIATYKFGSKDATAKKKDKQYEILLDEQIDFIQALKMPGNQKEKEVCVSMFCLLRIHWDVNSLKCYFH